MSHDSMTREIDRISRDVQLPQAQLETAGDERLLRILAGISLAALITVAIFLGSIALSPSGINPIGSTGPLSISPRVNAL